MALNQALLPEFDREMASTRRTLERVPEEKFGWKPHEKSGSMGWLAIHLATLPGWVTKTIDQDSLDFSPPGGPPYQPPALKTRKELLDVFDKAVADGRAAIAKTTDAHLMKPWALLRGGQQLFSAPRTEVLRSFVMNHVIHHRAQLGVYLRLNDIPVPSIYGPSADERPV